MSISARLASGGGGKNIFLKASILLLKVSAIVLSGFLKNGNLNLSLGFLFYFLPYFASFQTLRGETAKSYTIDRKYIYLAFLIILFFSSYTFFSYVSVSWFLYLTTYLISFFVFIIATIYFSF